MNAAVTLGARDSLELLLQDLKRDKARLIEESNALLSQADVYRALAAEPGRGTVAYNTRAANCRWDAVQVGVDIHNKDQEIQAVQAKLAALESPAQPVTFKAGQVEGQDETMDFGGVIA